MSNLPFDEPERYFCDNLHTHKENNSIGAASLYLPPEQANGCQYCLNPDSLLLRETLANRSPKARQSISTSALVNDVFFFGRLLH